ncbi:MAG: M14 family zinc carboxypeptidase [Rhodothermales bacterium]
MRLHKIGSALLAVMLFAVMFLWQQTFAQERFVFDPQINYASSIPSPASYLGYELGEHFTLHAHMLDYFEALAASSDNVTLHEYGRTYEGRRLVYAVITSAANQARIDEIQENNVRLADPTDNSAADAIEDLPLVHWMSYNVHGNEPSSTEAAMQVAYRLAAGQDAQTQQMLDDLVVIIDPCINPDGRDRYVYWYKSMFSKHLNTDAEDIEHLEPWPGGRTNHYWFDLNRDWVWLVHPESQGRIKAYQEWMPQVHIDYHEQGYNNNYFTHPGTTPRNLNLPKAHFDWEAQFGKGDAEAFDKEGISYFTSEAFDFYYPGYGSSYPSLMGGIAMLREQGGHSRGGRAVKTNDDYVLTLRQRLYDHYLTSVAGMQTSVDNRAALMNYFRDALTPAKSNTRPEKAYLIPDSENDYSRELVSILLSHGVEVARADEAFTVPAAYDYWTNKPARRQFDAGTFVVKSDQARHLFVNTLLQRQMVIEDSIMYDMATWSAPIAYNLDAAWTERNISVNSTPVDNAPGYAGTVSHPNATYAFVIEWSQRHAPAALSRLWEAGYAVRSIKKPMHIGEEQFARGSLVILAGRNRDKADQMSADMQRIAQEAGVAIHGYDSGWIESGINPASSNSVPVKKPKVGLVLDTPFNSYTAGQLWFLLEEWTHLPINRLRLKELASVELSSYDVLLFPGARGGLSSHLDSTGIEMLRSWIKAGGTLIGTENSALFLTKDQSGLSKIEITKKEKKEGEEEEAFEPGSLEDPYLGLEARKDARDLNNIPGSAIRSYLDTTHPLAFGMPETLYSLKFGNAGLEPSTTAQVVGHYHQKADSVLASGYMSVENREKLAGKAFAMTENQGRGKVVLLLDNTQYRMFWVGTARLMQNAVMLVPDM